MCSCNGPSGPAALVLRASGLAAAEPSASPSLGHLPCRRRGNFGTRRGAAPPLGDSLRVDQGGVGAAAGAARCARDGHGAPATLGRGHDLRGILLPVRCRLGRRSPGVRLGGNRSLLQRLHLLAALFQDFSEAVDLGLEPAHFLLRPLVPAGQPRLPLFLHPLVLPPQLEVALNRLCQEGVRLGVPFEVVRGRSVGAVAQAAVGQANGVLHDLVAELALEARRHRGHFPAAKAAGLLAEAAEGEGGQTRGVGEAAPARHPGAVERARAVRFVHTGCLGATEHGRHVAGLLRLLVLDEMQGQHGHGRAAALLVRRRPRRRALLAHGLGRVQHAGRHSFLERRQ
mmetsp:Transcript_38579/g.111276  ORF Transcript_38579/g.111276 Transcript_38579/m.111276 type:complete len:342 (+) Transcript_38579:247-1272(+)